MSRLGDIIMWLITISYPLMIALGIAWNMRRSGTQDVKSDLVLGIVGGVWTGYLIHRARRSKWSDTDL